MEVSSTQLHKELNHIWVFGYGSLIWKPNFTYADRVIGYVEGFERRFWQGTTYHRGTKAKPGRVVTLVDKENSVVWGVAYKIEGNESIRKALGHLRNREQALGCYDSRHVNFQCRSKDGSNMTSFSVLTYYATPGNSCYLGAASNFDVASDIYNGSGVSGSNIEYLFRLADFMRDEVHEENDDHLFEVDNLVRQKIGLCTKNITSWLELLQNRKFVNMLRKHNPENSENLIVA